MPLLLGDMGYFLNRQAFKFLLTHKSNYIQARKTIIPVQHHLFGTLALTCSILPHFRQKRSGVIAFIGSIGGWAGDPGASPHCGTKFALEG